MANRQTLIHLHGNGRLEEASKLNQGEIAVRNAATAADTELAVLTSGGALVYIPSIDKVTGITNTITTDLDTAEEKITALEDKVGNSKVSDQITRALSGLNYNTPASSEDQKVTVTVTQVDGAITGVAVATDGDIASASGLAQTNTNLTALATRVTTAEGMIDELTGDGDGSVSKQIATALNDLDYDKSVTSSVEGEGKVTVSITQVKGEITAHTVTTEDVASKTVLEALDDKVDDLVVIIDGFKTGDTSIANQITTELGKLDYNESVTSAVTGEGKVTVSITQENGKITAHTVTTEDVASKTVLEALDDKVDTLIGGDADKSVRTIANEELAKQLVPEDAKESLDTLQEIADWIQNHPDDVSAMNSEITKNTNAITGLTATLDGYNSTDTVKKAIEAVQTKANNNETAIATLNGNGDGSVSKQIATALNDLDYDKSVTSSVEGEGKVTVSITQVDGEITAHTVTTEDVASAAALEGVDTRVGALEGKLSGTTGNVSTQIATELGKLNYNNSVASEGEAKVTVSITQVDGKITGHTVTTEGIASAQDLADTNDALDAVKTTANSAVQTVSVANTATNKITATKTGTTVELNFDNMVIDCGTY